MKTWQTKKLGEVCDLIKGKKPTIFVSKSDKPYLTAKVIRKIENPKFASEKCASSVWVKKEDIVIIMDGSNSGEMFTGLDGALASTMGIINYSKDLLFSRYLLYFLITHRENFTKSRTGAAIPHLNKEGFENLEIPLPPIPEQRRIVKILDGVFGGVEKAKENAEKNLANAKELFESYLQSVFEDGRDDWEEKRLKEVCEKITDGTHQTPKYFDSGYIFLSSRNVKTGLIDWENIKYIDEKQHLEMQKRVSPQKGDILLAKNGTTGVAAMVDKDDKFDIYVSLAWLRSLGEIDSNFLLYFINSPVAKKQFNKRLKGSGVPNLHLEEIREVIIKFPKSLNKQKAIVKKLDALSGEAKKLEAIYRQKLADLEELKKSVLKKAFNGEL